MIVIIALSAKLAEPTFVAIILIELCTDRVDTKETAATVENETQTVCVAILEILLVDDADIVGVEDTVIDLVDVPVMVAEVVAEAVGVGETVDEEVGVGVPESLPESEFVTLGLDPTDKLDVAVPVKDLAALTDAVDEDDDVGVKVDDAVGLGVMLEDIVLVIDDDSEKVGVIEALAPGVIEEVGVILDDGQSELTLLLVGEGVIVEDAVPETVDVGEGLAVRVVDIDFEMVEVYDDVTEVVGELRAVPPIESVDDDDNDDDEVPLGLEVLLSLPVADKVSVVEPVGDEVWVVVGVGVFELVFDVVKGAEIVLLIVIEGVTKEEGEILDEAPIESVLVAEKEGVEVALVVVVIEFDSDNVADEVWVGVRELEAVPESVGVKLLLIALVNEELSVFEPVGDALAPILSVAVSERLFDEELVTVDVAVLDGVGDEVLVVVIVGVRLIEASPETLWDEVGVGVDEELAPNVNDDVGETERDVLNEIEEEGVILGVTVDEDVIELVTVPDGEKDIVPLELNERLGENELVPDIVGVLLAVPP